jgi:hypothetical protein
VKVQTILPGTLVGSANRCVVANGTFVERQPSCPGPTTIMAGFGHCDWIV